MLSPTEKANEIAPSTEDPERHGSFSELGSRSSSVLDDEHEVEMPAKPASLLEEDAEPEGEEPQQNPGRRQQLAPIQKCPHCNGKFRAKELEHAIRLHEVFPNFGPLQTTEGFFTTFHDFLEYETFRTKCAWTLFCCHPAAFTCICSTEILLWM
ncbi:unnamed protein product [Amoebophrya sp. A25]|nr:unnamed protein product [Amoebophrya sp. A25]|eukprot:GSA25T00009940001.1